MVVEPAFQFSRAADKSLTREGLSVAERLEVGASKSQYRLSAKGKTGQHFGKETAQGSLGFTENSNNARRPD